MASYADELGARFDDGGPTCEGAPDEPFLRRLLTRRTVRAYEDRVPDEMLLDLLTAAALSASSKSDFQQASILRVVDPERRAALGALFPAMPWIGAAPAFLVFLGDARRLDAIGRARGKPVANGTLEGFFNATVDAALALQTCVLAAEAAGLGCCPISVLRNRIDAVAEILDLPDLVFPVAGLCLGYPARAGFVSLRLPRSVTSHRDTYAATDPVPAIDAYDRRRHARHAIPAEQHRANAVFGTAAFYGWSEDKARQAAQPEGAAFPVYLRAHGFTFN
ncbi:nitroreductase family protein [Methylobacterium sp. JK268]